MKLLVLVAPFVCAAIASAQEFNVRFGATSPVPSSTFGAAASQPGTWNGVFASVTQPLTTALVDVNGAASAVTITNVDPFNDGSWFNPETTGDVELLLDIYTSPTSCCGSYVVDGLQAGDYEVYTYAWAPGGSLLTGVEIVGSIDPLQNVGGPWAGGLLLGTTHAHHRIHVDAGASLRLNITVGGWFGVLNAMQIVRSETGPPFCFGDGTGTACPCANNGAPGRGCANSTGQGALLEGSGFPDVSSDTFVLSVSGMPSTATVLFFQGDAQLNGGLGVPFGDGLRCAGGAVIRLGTKTASGGIASYPEANDAPIALLGAIPGTGGARYYQAWYRNSASFCTPDPFNLSNGLAATWVP